MRSLLVLIVVMTFTVSFGRAEEPPPPSPNPADATKQRVEAERKSRESDEGQRALAPLTDPKSRVQFRLVLKADDKGEADEMIDPSSPAHPKIRVAKEVFLNERAVDTAKASNDGTVAVRLIALGGRQMECVTSRNMNHRLAIVFDGKLLMAPTILSTMGARIVIAGGRDGFTAAETQQLVDALLSGAEGKAGIK